MSRARAVRAGIKGSVAAGATLFFFCLCLVGAPLRLLSGRSSARWRDLCFRSWSRSLLRILGVRLQVEGSPSASPTLLVANHLSYLDIPILASQLPAVFVAKAEVRDWPVVGVLCRAVDTVFVDRGSKRDLPQVVRAIEEALGREDGVVFFPEGTSTPGETIERFRSSLLAPAVSAGLAVSWAVLHYSTPAGEPDAGDSVCWWGDAEFGPHLWQLLTLPSVDARLVFGEKPEVGEDRKELAKRLRREMLKRFQPSVCEEVEERWVVRESSRISC